MTASGVSQMVFQSVLDKMQSCTSSRKEGKDCINTNPCCYFILARVAFELAGMECCVDYEHWWLIRRGLNLPLSTQLALGLVCTK